MYQPGIILTGNFVLILVGRPSPSSLNPSTESPGSPPLVSVNGIASPLLTALEVVPTTDNSNDITNEWASNIPFGRSPPNGHADGLSVAGSPPKAFALHGGELRGGFSNASPSTSPQAAYRQPVRRNNGYQSFGDYLGSSPSHSKGRPASMYTQYPQAPPLPHHPQPHYYGAPNIDIGFPQLRSESRKAGDGYCCVFDSLASAGDETPALAANTLLVGFEGGLMVYKVEKDRFNALGRLEGLRGAVIGAKILPCSLKTDPIRSFRPLVVVIVHGPADLAQSRGQSRPASSSSNDEFDPSGSMLQALYSTDVTPPKPATQYQTTVEIYSLKGRQHVATLFKSPMVKLERLPDAQAINVPPPMGNLSIRASGRFITVTSATSGEVYVFESSKDKAQGTMPSFRCLGKVWTSIPLRKTRSYSTSSTSSEPDNPHEAPLARSAPPTFPILALSHRWLAIVPPRPSVRSTLHGTVDLPVLRQKPPGLTSHTAPSQPQPTCDLDTPEGESLLNRVARDVTQEVIKGARWVGDQGMQVWNNYWNKPPEPNSQSMHPPMVQAMQQNFPPTHAHDERRAQVDSHPTLVSIIDLEKLSESQDAKPAVALQPIATFTLPSGCSFISFAPNGLSLLTASAKGDVQHVWDLMRMVHGKMGLTAAPEGNMPDKGPSIRQIARFTRMTVASIVDVVWTEPRGERLAMVTDKGTVHIFDLPPSAFQWPPPRRIARPVTAPGVTSATTAHSTTLDAQVPSGALTAALNMVQDRTQPLLAAVRGRPPSISNAFAGLGNLNFTAGAGAKGGKVVAAGISKSAGAATATVNSIRHMGENRLHIPGPPHSITHGCVRWLGGKDRSLIAITGGGMIRIHNVRQSTNAKVGKRRPSVVGGRPTEFPLPNIPTATSQTSSDEDLTTGSDVSIVGGYWPHPTGPSDLQKPAKGSAHPLSYAEIETNAPYQPFHTDRRIGLHVYSFDETLESDPHHLQETSPWVFGEDIPTTKVNVGSATFDDLTHAESGLDGLPAQMENLISLEGNEEEGQQVVVTTRRKRGKKGEVVGDEDEDFFEDDCEVVDFAEERV